jgi:Mrp family chromosome partitioning ATPase
MSKNFELMQAIRWSDLGPPETNAPSSNTASKATRFDHEGAPSKPKYRSLGGYEILEQESWKLAQQVFLLPSRPLHMVVFAGIDHGTGCTEVCTQVAQSLAAHTSSRVCLVDGNFRTPCLARIFGLQGKQGLSDSLVADAPLRECAHQVGPTNLWLVPAGSSMTDASLLGNLENLKATMAEIQRCFDYVLIDAPPLARYSEGIMLGRFSEAVVLVLEANSTRRDVARKVTDNLRESQVEVAAAVLNKRKFPIPESLYRRF